MLRRTWRYFVSNSRIAINSSKFINSHHHRFLRHITSDSNGTTLQSKIPLADINNGEAARRMGIRFRCKICDHTLNKTFTRQSYEHGIVIIRCDSCSNLHLIADNLGWFKDLTHNGKFKNIAQMLQAKGETIHRVTTIPTDDPSVLKEEQIAEETLLNDEKSKTS